MPDSPEHLTIGAFARAAGVGVETVRFYHSEHGQISCPLIDALHR